MAQPYILNVLLNGDLYEVVVGGDNHILKITHFYAKSQRSRILQFHDLHDAAKQAIIEEYKKHINGEFEE